MPLRTHAHTLRGLRVTRLRRRLRRTRQRGVASFEEQCVLSSLYTEKEASHAHEEREREKANVLASFEDWTVRMAQHWRAKKLRQQWMVQEGAHGTRAYFNMDTGLSQTQHPHARRIGVLKRKQKQNALCILRERQERLTAYAQEIVGRERATRTFLQTQCVRVVGNGLLADSASWAIALSP
jgi:hypothetical protein